MMLDPEQVLLTNVERPCPPTLHLRGSVPASIKMPTATYLQARRHAAASPPILETRDEAELDLQTSSSSLRQHLDSEALPRPDFFETLDELHLWYQMQYGDILQDHLESCSKHKYPPSHSSSSATAGSRPKLVVCHDFQGGYTESPHRQGYTLEHMHLVDTFIYFSHKRVSIPPVGWLTAASRTGTKVLGTLIFEWAESVPDMARLLRGPERKAMPLRGDPSFSPQYAIELIQFALDRGFSGYLVNIETALDLGFSCSGEAWPVWVGEQARIGEMHRNSERLRGWVHYLREEGTRRFVEAGRNSDEWQVMWYDSVVYPHGQLAWQDALNEHNVPFYQSAHTFFTNYTWARPPQPLPPGELIDPDDESPQNLQRCGFGLTGEADGGLHPQLLLSAAMADSVARPRNEVYVGIDVFGRNCWGGLKSWKSLEMIGPHRQDDEKESLGLSVALFAPGWTWEGESAGLALTSEQAERKRSWVDWWHIDIAFWVGVPTSLAPASYRIPLSDSEAKPVQRYFHHSNLQRDRLRRRASRHGFYTNFSFGSGTKWFDQGTLVHEWSAGSKDEEAGFTDMGVCMPKPDLFYLAWHHLQKTMEGAAKLIDGVENATWWYDHHCVWEGTASFAMFLSPSCDDQGKVTDRMTVPLCSAVMLLPEAASGEAHDWKYTLVCQGEAAILDALQPHVMHLGESKEEGQLSIEHSDVEQEALSNNWRAFSVQLKVRRSLDDANRSIMALSLGFSVHPLTTSQIKLRIGALQLSSSAKGATVSQSTTPSALEVRLATSIAHEGASPATIGSRVLPVALTWTSPSASLASAYFNIWLQAAGKPETKAWLGTSTREATLFEFCLPNHLVLPYHLRQLEPRDLNFVVTSLGILHPQTVAKGLVILS